MAPSARLLIPCGLAAVFLVALPFQAAQAGDFDHAYGGCDRLLKTYVADGLVDYNGLKHDPKQLHRFLDSAAAIPEAQFGSWSEPVRPGGSHA